MTIWIDAQLSPALTEWLEANFDVDSAVAVPAGLAKTYCPGSG
jgi:predicted nuclease of predicted toxin-antitoxin system